MGSIHHLTKFIPNLAELSEPLRPLLRKENTTTSKNLNGKKNTQQHSQTLKTNIQYHLKQTFRRR